METKQEMFIRKAEEFEAYNAGYDWNEQFGGKKEW